MTRFLAFLMVCFVVAGCIFIYMGLDKKDNYYASNLYSSLDRNVYVGGDAYNYIINANYFVGYVVLAGIMWLMSGMCGIGMAIINNRILHEWGYEKLIKKYETDTHE